MQRSIVVPIHDGNFLLYSAKAYMNPHCYDESEFYEDLNRFKYLKRLFNKFNESNELRERLILNHIITIYNLFGPEASTRMLMFKLQEYHSTLVPFIIFLNLMPDRVHGIGPDNKTIITSEIPLNQTVINSLRKI
jgi:hypothetical protein